MSGTGSSFFSPPNVRRGVTWLQGGGTDADVVISSRVRLARNLAGFPFLTRSTREQRQEVLDLVRDRLLSPAGARIAEQMLWVDVHSAPPMDRTLMVERHLISKEHARGAVPGSKAAEEARANEGTPSGKDAGAATGAGSSGSSGGAAGGTAGGTASGAVMGEPRGVCVSLPDETVSIMVNEEDHLRVQVLLPGLQLAQAFARANEVDDRIEGPCPGRTGAQARSIAYAFNPRFGYLTACPTNVGSGIRVSVMLHLPALKMAGEMDKVKRATRDMSLAVRGYYGEGSEAAGEFYQISNQTTLGKSESVILEELEKEILPQVIAYERAARKMLLDKRRRALEDKVFRSLGTLRYARLLTPEESITLLSDVRLGITTGLVKDVDESQLNQLILLTQPAHLQRALGREMDQGSRREARADLVRQVIGAR